MPELEFFFFFVMQSLKLPPPVFLPKFFFFCACIKSAFVGYGMLILFEIGKITETKFLSKMKIILFTIMVWTQKIIQMYKKWLQNNPQNFILRAFWGADTLMTSSNDVWDATLCAVLIILRSEKRSILILFHKAVLVCWNSVRLMQ